MQTTAVPRYALNAESIALNAPMIFAKIVNFVPNVPIFLTAAETVYTVQRLRVYSFALIVTGARIAPKVFVVAVDFVANVHIYAETVAIIVVNVQMIFAMAVINVLIAL